MKRTHADAFPVSVITSPLVDTDFGPLCLDLFAEAILTRLNWHNQRALACTSTKFYEYLMGTEDKAGRARIYYSWIDDILVEFHHRRMSITLLSYRTIASLLHVVLEEHRHVLPPAWRPFLSMKRSHSRWDTIQFDTTNDGRYFRCVHYPVSCIFSFAGISICKIPLVMKRPIPLSVASDLDERRITFQLDDARPVVIDSDNIKIITPAINQLIASLAAAHGPASKKRRIDD